MDSRSSPPPRMLVPWVTRLSISAKRLRPLLPSSRRRRASRLQSVFSGRSRERMSTDSSCAPPFCSLHTWLFWCAKRRHFWVHGAAIDYQLISVDSCRIVANSIISFANWFQEYPVGCTKLVSDPAEVENSEKRRPLWAVPILP